MKAAIRILSTKRDFAASWVTLARRNWEGKRGELGEAGEADRTAEEMDGDSDAHIFLRT